MKKINKKINIAVIGLGQIGSYIANEIMIKKKDIYLNEAINILEDLKLNFISENKLISFN